MTETTHPGLPLAGQLGGEHVVLRPYRAGDGATFAGATDRDREDSRTSAACVDTGSDGSDWAPRLDAGDRPHEDARGRGDGTKSVRRVTGLSRHSLGMRRIRASCGAKNERGGGLLQRCADRRGHHGGRATPACRP